MAVRFSCIFSFKFKSELFTEIAFVKYTDSINELLCLERLYTSRVVFNDRGL